MSQKVHIAIVISQFNKHIIDLLLDGALERLQEMGIILSSSHVYQVPGAIEIPVVAACLAQSQSYNAIICLGAVIRGETSHYDYVCFQVSYGCQKVALQYGIPVIFGVLTTDNERQALDRCGGSHGHKGRECVDAAFEMVALMERVK